MNIEASLFSAGCHQIIFGQPPLTRPPRLFNTFGVPDAGTERIIADWNKSNQAGVFSISLNVSASHKFLIQQNRQANVLELWEAIRLHHLNNTEGHNVLVRQKWQAYKQGPRTSLEDYITSYSRLYNALIQTGGVRNRKNELSQFLAGLDLKKHSTVGLAGLEFRAPGADSFENVISHLRSQEGRKQRSNILHGDAAVPVETVHAPAPLSVLQAKERSPKPASHPLYCAISAASLVTRRRIAERRNAEKPKALLRQG